MKKKRCLYITAIVLSCILSAAFTYGVINYDVRAIGPYRTKVGFGYYNKKIAEFVGVNYDFYKIAEFMGYLIIVICAIFAMAGLVQWIKRRSLFKVDSNILVLGGLYAAVFGIYVFFEKVIVNYRPVIMRGEYALEASFPSSHTIMAVVVILGAMMQLKYYIKRRIRRIPIDIILSSIMFETIAFRFLSGAHWTSDIVAAVLYSGTLIFIYGFILFEIDNKRAMRNDGEEAWELGRLFADNSQAEKEGVGGEQSLKSEENIGGEQSLKSEESIGGEQSLKTEADFGGEQSLKIEEGVDDEQSLKTEESTGGEQSAESEEACNAESKEPEETRNVESKESEETCNEENSRELNEAGNESIDEYISKYLDEKSFNKERNRGSGDETDEGIYVPKRLKSKKPKH